MKTILIPTDFSNTAGNAMKYAIQMSKTHGFKLVFVHVYSLPYLNPEAGMVYDASFSVSMQKQAEKTLAEQVENSYTFFSMHRNLLQTELEVVDAISLSSGIKKISLKYKADFIIMGTHGASGLKKVFLGSNAVDMIENGDVPVLTVPENFKFDGIKDIAYASDFTEVESELKRVCGFADIFNAGVRVIHITKNVATDSLNSILLKWKNTIGYQKIGLHIVNTEEQLSIDSAIKQFNEEFKSDLLVVFHQERNFWKGLFERSTATELVYDWQTPVLTLYK